MRKVAVGVSVSILVSSGLVLADGYYSNDGGPGSINWPPPGGVAGMPPQRPAYPQAQNSSFRPYSTTAQPTRRYKYPLPSQQFRNELITPPDENWPQSAYFQGAQEHAGKLPAAVMQRGAPVEVIPPPGVPVSEAGMPLSEKPERGFRPMKEQQQLEALEESLEPPKPKNSKPTLMREIKSKQSPLLAPVVKPPTEAVVLPGASEISEKPSPGTELAPKEQPLSAPFSSGMSVQRPR